MYLEQKGNLGYYLQVEEMVISEFEDTHGQEVADRLREFFNPDLAEDSKPRKKADLQARAKETVETDPSDEAAFDSVNRRIEVFERWVS